MIIKSINCPNLIDQIQLILYKGFSVILIDQRSRERQK